MTKKRIGKRKSSMRRKSTSSARRRSPSGARRGSTGRRGIKRAHGTTKRKRATVAARGRTTSRPKRTKSTTLHTREGIVTTDHDQIRRWVEERGGQPACVRGTGDAEDVGLLRIDFPGYTGAESLQSIGWDEFFDRFDERKLAFLHHEQTNDGGRSYFNKLISRPATTRAGGSTHGRSS